MNIYVKSSIIMFTYVWLVMSKQGNYRITNSGACFRKNLKGNQENISHETSNLSEVTFSLSEVIHVL